MAISPAEILNVILNEDDFGHEMRVGNILDNVQYPQSPFERTRIMPPSHGGTYTDQVTNKTRQFDYRCRIIKGYENTDNIFLAIECKNLNPDLPLVICGRPRTDEEAYHVFIEKPGEENPRLRKVEDFSSIYKPDEFVGKSLIRLRKKENKLSSDKDSEIYDKWAQALASSYDLAYDSVYRKPQSLSRAFIIPMVVVPNDSLWTVNYKNDGTPDGAPKLVEQCEFYVDQKLLIGLPFVLTHIHFVTLEGLSGILSEFAHANSHKWDEIFNAASFLFNP